MASPQIEFASTHERPPHQLGSLQLDQQDALSAVQGIVVAQAFLARNNISPGIPVVSRTLLQDTFPLNPMWNVHTSVLVMPTSVTSAPPRCQPLPPLSGVEHSGLVLTSTEAGTPGVLMSTGEAVELHNLGDLHRHLGHTSDAVTQGWQVLEAPELATLLRQYRVAQWLFDYDALVGVALCLASFIAGYVVTLKLGLPHNPVVPTVASAGVAIIAVSVFFKAERVLTARFVRLATRVLLTV